MKIFLSMMASLFIFKLGYWLGVNMTVLKYNSIPVRESSINQNNDYYTKFMLKNCLSKNLQEVK